jgi:hypothetical protein
LRTGRILFGLIRQVYSLEESKEEGGARGKRIRRITIMWLYASRRDLKSSCGSLAFHTIKRDLIIYGKRRLPLKRRLARQILLLEMQQDMTRTRKSGN